MKTEPPSVYRKKLLPLKLAVWPTQAVDQKQRVPAPLPRKTCTKRPVAGGEDTKMADSRSRTSVKYSCAPASIRRETSTGNQGQQCSYSNMASEMAIDPEGKIGT